MKGLKISAIAVGRLVMILGFIWLAQGNDFFMYKYFAPKYEEVRREVFENTPSYNWGMIQELQNMQFKYEQATPNEKLVLAPIILHRVNQFGMDKLPPDLKVFVSKLKTERSGSKY